MTGNLFSSDVELGKFLFSADVIPDVYGAISDTYTSHQFNTNPCAYDLYTKPSGLKVLAFHCSPDYIARFLSGEFDLVSSKNYRLLDFISTKGNPSFLINQAAVDLFEYLFVEISQLENQLIDDPLVVTGQSLGGYLAILFTLWLQHVVDVKESNGYWGSKRPICITFGSPLIGDEALQCAIFEHPRWKSCLLNVVAKNDHVASFSSSSSLYKPFGTFLFCIGLHTVFEDQDSVLAVLETIASSKDENMESHNYGNDLKLTRRKVLYHGIPELGESDCRQESHCHIKKLVW